MNESKIKVSGLNAKLLELQKSTRGLFTDAKSGTGPAGYNYVSGNKLLSVVRPKMDELGLILIPEVVDVQATRQDYQTRNGVKSEIYTIVMMTMTWVDTESGEEKVCKWAGTGQNQFDKGFGSALTYGERYFLLKFLHLQTDKDDVDAIVRDEPEVTYADVMGWINSSTTLDQLKKINHDWAKVFDITPALSQRKQQIQQNQ